MQQQVTELPPVHTLLHCTASVVDVSTLTKTLLELKANGIQTKENIKELYKNGVFAPDVV